MEPSEMPREIYPGVVLRINVETGTRAYINYGIREKYDKSKIILKLHQINLRKWADKKELQNKRQQFIIFL